MRTRVDRNGVSLELSLDKLRLDQLQNAIRANRISFPSQVPVFIKHADSKLQCHVVLLYFVRGWSCDRIAKRYGFCRQFVWSIVSEWRRHAAAVGYLQVIPPPEVLSALSSSSQKLERPARRSDPRRTSAARKAVGGLNEGSESMMASHPYRVLIVEHEPRFCNVLRTSLNTGEFIVVGAHSGEEALDMAQDQGFDLALLDVNLPGIGGFEACRRLKNLSPRTGVVVMLKARDLKHDTVHALEASADDYVTKPFELRELIGRLRVVLCRVRALGTREPSALRVGALTMDPRRRILWRSGSKVHLSPREYELLAFMMENQGALLSHKLLLRSVWGPSYGNEVEYLRAYVRSLRKKIEANPSNPDYILTAPWIGYRFCNPATSPLSTPA